MPRTGLAYDDVADAIHALEKAGLTPSIRLIREKLGKGSLSTIAEHKRAFDAKQATGPGPALPDPIVKQLIAGAQTYWQELVEAAEADVAAAREAAQAEVDSLKKKLTAAEDEVATLRDAVGERDSRIEVLQQAAEAQAVAQAELGETLQEKRVDVARLEADLDALKAQYKEVVDDRQALTKSLSAADAERATLNERLEQQAAEFARGKATLQKHFNEYKDRLVTMSDEGRQANQARRDAEAEAVTAREQASALEHENERLSRELVDARDEARLLADQLGEARGELESARQSSESRLADRDAQLEASTQALDEAQSLLRQYVATDRSLVQELIDERKASRSSGET